ncbi:MAG: hypothetical protein ACD_37C00228G0002 [uncultured bacterium]|nr:MAG: hypothetical protein ACD_37C00228G0002 [uncultured bacterium]
MKKIKRTYRINSSIEKVWQALVDPKTIYKWGAGPAKMSGELDFEFELWGGDIFGKNIEVIPNKKIVQEWFGGKWDKPSIATFKLSSKENETRIDFTNTDVPDAEFSDIEKGWDEYYFGPMKNYLEDNN